MSGPSNLKRLRLQDLPGAPKWAEKLVDAHNEVVDSIDQSLSKGGITLAANLGSVKELEVRTTASYADPGGEFTRIRFPSGLVGRKASMVIIGYAQDLDFPDAALSGPIGCEGAWRESGGMIIVDWVTGLEASHRYRLRFGVFA